MKSIIYCLPAAVTKGSGRTQAFGYRKSIKSKRITRIMEDKGNSESQNKPKLTRQERDLCNKKRRELNLITKRLEVSAELKIKIILVGDTSVGKTSLIHKFVDNKADIRRTQVTLLCDFHHCLVQLTGRAVHIRIWDTGGMERFHDKNLVGNFYRNSDGVLLVFSVDDHKSFESLPRWLERVRENIGQNSQFDCGIIGNKSDLTEKRQVSRHEAERFANHHGFTYIETSALEVFNVHKAFMDVALAVIKRNQTVQQFTVASRRDSCSQGASESKICSCG